MGGGLRVPAGSPWGGWIYRSFIPRPWSLEGKPAEGVCPLNREELKGMIREVLLDILKDQGVEGSSVPKVRDPSGVLAVRAGEVRPERFDTGKPSDRVYLKDILSLEESPRLGCGVMEMERSTFKWTLRYDEVDYVIDGTLEIVVDGRRVVGHKGDVIFIPANSTIHFSTPDFVRFLYVTYPADWASQ
ncbi:cupin domain-containing protein [Thermanaerovibrio acidaminovorans]|uniref:Ethanolamine utilisation EutQ family protein n=1 Tax=Thermanaerovibrio acidaminovorans (strain ATCC 49978 / DSM 6589 / Su883) TaxID=525903 RepID=D1B7R8_THEAS|nr:Ethanolamine utilisation EutQ family protein [Thermanaerovibrio acidaminovorans DSM 6589]